MHLHTRTALLLALTPILGCRMLYITGEQGESSTTGTSITPPILTTLDTSSTKETSTGTSFEPSSTSAATTPAEETEHTNSTTGVAISETYKPESDTSATTYQSTSTTENASTLSTEDTNPSSDEDSTTSPESHCGDLIIENKEECDDGPYNATPGPNSAPFCTNECTRHGRYVFITSKGDFAGNLANNSSDIFAGAIAADNHCTEVAKNIPGVDPDTKFVAWISTQFGPFWISPSIRLGSCSHPYYLPKLPNSTLNTRVAWNFNNLTKPNNPKDMPPTYLSNQIDIDENAQLTAKDAIVLTATTALGKLNISGSKTTCSNWTSADQSKKVGAGNNSKTTEEWTNSTDDHFCSEKKYHLYCFEKCP